MNTPAKDLTGSSVAGGTPETDQLETLVQIELVGTLARQSRDASLIAPIGSLFLAFLQIGYVPLMSILAWLALVTIPDALTLLRSYKFDRVPRTLAAMRSWQAHQTLIHSFAGLAWGSSMVFFVGDATPIEHEMKIVLVLMVVSALAVIPVSTSLASLTGFLIGITAIPLYHYFAGSHPGHLWLALGSLILLGCALHFGRIAHQQIRAHVLSSAINDRLASALSDANLTINETNRKLQEKNLALTHAMENLNNQATHDELTGLYNRRYILQRLEDQWQDIRRYHTACSIALLDIDHFKLVNDRFGHGIGDLVLKGFASRIQGELRQGDIFARYGGEEFLLVLPMTELEAAGKLVDRLRQIIEETPIIDEPLTICIRSSFGVAELLPAEAVHDCISRADRALYRAKESGRNRVELAGKDN
jgi:diguanylate cyclase (GGDEF)-like protein